MAELEAKRRKLLELHYADKIGADLYAEEEQHLRQQFDLARADQGRVEEAARQASDLERRFEEVAALLASLDIEEVALFPDHLEVVVAGAPRLNVTLEEVGVQNRGVRGGT